MGQSVEPGAQTPCVHGRVKRQVMSLADHGGEMREAKTRAMIKAGARHIALDRGEFKRQSRRRARQA